jgi:hypothetical protein
MVTKSSLSLHDRFHKAVLIEQGMADGQPSFAREAPVQKKANFKDKAAQRPMALDASRA